MSILPSASHCLDHVTRWVSQVTHLSDTWQPRPQPMQAAPRKWTYVAFPDSRGSNGVPFGLGLNLQPNAERLVIFLGGGEVGADAEICSQGYSSDRRALSNTWWCRGAGIFNREDPLNPLANASYVVIPAVNYDRHMGNRTTAYWASPPAAPDDLLPDFPSERRWVAIEHRGAANFERFLPRIAATFPQVKQVVLAGESAGGFGASYHVPRVRAAFRGKELLVLNDSGPYLPRGHELFNGPKVQAWGLRKTVAKGWESLLPSAAKPQSGSCNMYKLTAKLSLRHGPPVRTALITSVWDPCINDSYGLSLAQFETAVRQLPAQVSAEDPHCRVFLINRAGHTWLRQLRDTHSCGAPEPVPLSGFLDDFLRNGPGSHVAQPPLACLGAYAARMRGPAPQA